MLGFTLIEMLTVVAISALLLSIVLPGWQEFVQRQALSAHVDLFASALRYTRTQAMRLGQPVSLCRSHTANTAQPSCAADGAPSTGSYASGWLIFLDRDGNGTFNPKQGELLLRTQAALPQSGGITTRAGRTNAFVFRPTGLMASGASHLVFKASRATVPTRHICVAMQGRARVIPATSTLVGDAAACG